MVMLGLCVVWSVPPSKASSATAAVSAASQGQIGNSFSTGVYTTSDDRLTYTVYTERSGQRQALTDVQVSGKAYTVKVSASNDLAKVAILNDFDGVRARELSVFDQAKGASYQLEQALVPSAAWSPDAAQLAYAVEFPEVKSEIRLSDGSKPGTSVATITGRDVNVLGWSANATTLYIAYSPQLKDVATTNIASVDLSSGKLNDLFVGAFEGNMIRDPRLLSLSDGTLAVSFIKAGHMYGCGGTSSIVLAGVDGTILKEYGATDEFGYAAAIWSEDRTQVGFARWVCSLDKAELAKRSETENGVYLADLAGDQTYRLIDQVPGQFNLLAVGDQGLVLRSPVRGLATMGINAGTQSVESLEGSRRVESRIGTAAPSPNGYGYRNNWAGYIHQHYDTKDGFNGWWACGPTSSVMSIAYYILPTNYVWSSSPYGHGSNYGGWITNQYTWGSSTFSRSYYDPNGNWFQGAYGHHLADPYQGTVWAQLSDYLGRHIGYGETGTWGGMEDWLRAKLNESSGRLVIVSGNPFGRGHILLLKGYTDDGNFIFHDPAGYRVTNGYNGNDVVYAWWEMQAQHVWWD